MAVKKNIVNLKPEERKMVFHSMFIAVVSVILFCSMAFFLYSCTADSTGYQTGEAFLTNPILDSSTWERDGGTLKAVSVPSFIRDVRFLRFESDGMNHWSVRAMSTAGVFENCSVVMTDDENGVFSCQGATLKLHISELSEDGTYMIRLIDAENGVIDLVRH